MDACVLPNADALDCYYGETTPDAPINIPAGWCGVIHNNHWFAFTATQPTESFTVACYGCAQGNGVQAAVFSTPDCVSFNFVSNCLGNVPSGTQQTMTATGLIAGEVYYVCIDGSGGALCDYSINATLPTVNGPVNGICIPNPPVTYSTNTQSTWTINPPGAGVISGNAVATSVSVTWVQAGPAEICAQSTQCPNAPVECLSLNIGEDVITFESYDLCQGRTVQCAGRTFSGPGNFPVNLTAYTGCDSVVNCQIRLIPTVFTNETVILCPGGSVTCAGEEFYDPGNFPVKFESYTGCDSIVRCTVKLAPVKPYMPPPKVTLCGPAEYTICGTVFNTTGIHAEFCTSSLGCDSLVEVDLAILEPEAVIAPPDTLDCTVNTSIQLDGSGSSTNNIPGGTSFFFWSGPGIVGNSSLPIITVNQPGEYCLVMRHTRTGVFCYDTTCVTVVAVSAVPQLPQILGDPTPCAGDTVVYTALAVGNPTPTSYTWTVPPAYQFTQLAPNRVQVIWAADDPAGQICVRASNSCGSSQPACLPIQVLPQPVVPLLSGPTSVCAGGGAYLYTIDTIQAGTTYNWTVPPGAVISGGPDSVLIDFSAAVSGQVCINVQNICDTLAPICLNVTVNPVPTADLSGNAEICIGETTNLVFAFSGNGPFDILWNDGSQNVTLNNLVSGHTIAVSPTANTTYRLLSANDNSTPACPATVNDSVTVLVWPQVTTNLSPQICEGDSLLAGGAYQKVSGVYFDTLSTIHGCDSAVVTALTVFEIDTLLLTTTTCDPSLAGTTSTIYTQLNGCDSVVITGVSLLPSDSVFLTDASCIPANVGIFVQNLTNQYGCDSTVVTDVLFKLSDTTLISLSSCNPSEIGVFTEVLINSEGCDSTIITTVDFFRLDSTSVAQTTCDPAAAGVFYQTLITPAGCDSVIITTVSLLPSNTTNLFGSSCNPAEVGVFTVVETNQFGCDSTVITTIDFFRLDSTSVAETTCDPAAAGVFYQTLITPAGCDSVIITTVTLLPSNTTNLFGSSCNPAEVGVFTAVETNQFGCDSTVITTIAFAPLDTTFLTETTCDPGAAGVFANTLVTAAGCDSTIVTTVNLLPSNTTNLSGTSCNLAEVGVFTVVETNQFGCDSTVITTIAFVPLDTTFLTETTCDPGASGVFANTLITAAGCDSTIVTTVNLLPSDTVAFQTTTCAPAEVGVFTNVYPNQYGCDSTVTETVILLPSDTTYLTFTTCDPLEVGLVTTVLTNQYGCDSTVYATTTLRPPSFCGIEANMNGSDIPCLENTGSLTITVTLGEAPFTYTISAAGGVPVASGIVTAINTPEAVDGLAAGNYTLTITASTGFSTTSSATIVQLMSPNATATAVAAFNGFPISCTDQSDGTAVVTATGGKQPYTFAWSTTETSTQITDLPAGTYTVTVTDANGCTDVASVTLNEPELLQITFAITDLDCFGSEDGVIYVQPTGGVPPYAYTLNGGIPQTSNTFTGLDAGAYTVLTTDANDCEVTEIIVITAPIPLDVELGDNQTISLGESTVIEAVVNYPFDSLASIIWTPMPDTNSECPQCLILETTPLITTTYSVSIVANNGCRDEDKVTVIVDRRRFVYVPNVFSPDKDGDNDMFSVFAKDGTVSNIKSLEVYDRWGNAMYTITDFQPNDPALGWNGIFRGDDMNPGVYVWYMEVEFIDGVVELYKGDVTLIR